MSTNVGSIDLGLDINKKEFNNQLNGIAKGAEGSVKSAFGGLGKKIGAVLGTAAIAKFAKDCIDLGSDLSEVQNVVDVTFGNMAGDINSFAKQAITQFGLSETAAKQYSSTMGAMLKSMGFSTNKALEMSKAITGLSADMASFYNLDNEAAFEKIRAGISGETEPLKQLGINMSEANLSAFALSKGIKTAYSKMSQSNQALLRYNYLMSVTADAQGDFARTSKGWANQTRILKENFNGLKANMGQILINVLNPTLVQLNKIIEGLNKGAEAAKNFVNGFLGTEESTAAGAANMTGIAASAENAADGTAETAKEAKKLKSVLAGFDTLNLLDFGDESADDAAGAGAADGLNTAKQPSALNIDVKSNGTEVLDGLRKKFKELKDEFLKGLNLSLNAGKFPNTLKNLFDGAKRLKDALGKIVFDPDVQIAADGMAKAFMRMLGQIGGAAASIGAALANNVITGFANYLEQDEKFIKDRLISVAKSWETIFTQTGNTAEAIGNVVSGILNSNEAITITTDLIAGTSNAILGLADIGSRFIADFTKTVTQPFINNQEDIKNAAIGTLGAIQPVFDTFRKSVSDTFTKASQVYDMKLKPMWMDIENALDSITKTAVDGWNKYINPVISELSTKWSVVWSSNIQPTINKGLELLGSVGVLVGKVWKNIIAPFCSWFNDTFGPIISMWLEGIGNNFITCGLVIGGTIDGIITGLQWVVDKFIFVTDSLVDFKNNWQTGMEEIAGWTENLGENIKAVFTGLKNDAGELLKGVVNDWIDILNGFTGGLNDKMKIELPVDLKGNTKNFGLNIPKIPKLAQGGIIEQPTLAMVGERGKEAVMPLESNTAWIDMLAAKIASIINKNDGSLNGNNNRPIEIILQIGDAKFAKAVIKSINDLQNNAGKILLQI